MKINTLSSITFQKRLVALCQVENRNTCQKENCAIYKMDTKNAQDIKEIRHMPGFYMFKKSFLATYYQRYPMSDYYIVQNDDNGDIVSCAEISKHMQKYGWEDYIALHEIKGRKDYKNSLVPLIGYIANLAQNSGYQKIKTTFRYYDRGCFDRLKPDVAEDETMEIPLWNYWEYIKKAVQENGLTFDE